MKVLYCAFKHDPRDPDAASGVDHFFYTAMMDARFEMKIIGPHPRPTVLLERAFKRYYQQWTGKRYAKFPISCVWRGSRALNKAVKTWKPDVIFTIFPACTAFYQGHTPCVYDLDSGFSGWQRTYPQFGALAMRINIWQERRAFPRASRIITHGEFEKNILLTEYRIEESRIEVFPYPSALPRQAIPDRRDVPLHGLESPLRLLLVGRDRKRKGVDIAIETVCRLDAAGISAKLTVCGTVGNDSSHVQFVGPFKKGDPKQLREYVELYRRAHILLHPARFEPAGIVPSEAAAFAVPTITNATGGLPTAVADNESGIVLPKDSRAEAYVRAIVELVRNPQRYCDLRGTTRRRYERELNWDVAAKRVAAVLRQAAGEKSPA